MFHDFYGMSALPFEERTTPDKLLADERFAKGLDRLDYSLHSGGLAAVLTGPTGVGKSSLLRLFLSRLPGNRYQPLLLQQTALESASFLRLVVTAMGEKPRSGKDRVFAQILAKARVNDRITLLVVDEAHLLNELALTDLRLLLCAGNEDSARLRLLLCGQDCLLHTLARQNLSDLLNRVCVRIQLGPLTPDQTACYLDHRMTAVGGSEKTLTDDAKRRLHDYAGGVPRILNNIATLCLIQGAVKKQKQITPALVDEAAQELRLL